MTYMHGKPPLANTINPERLAAFRALYSPALEAAVRDHPDEYPWDISNVPLVTDKMMAAVVDGHYNKDGRAFKAVCKHLGIKHTYAAITAYLEGK